MFDEMRFTGALNNMHTPNEDGPSLAHGQSLHPAALHDLCMLYLQKTAYDGITPEQLTLEYFLAKTRIGEFMLQQNEDSKEGARKGAQGYRLADSIPPEDRS